MTNAWNPCQEAYLRDLSKICEWRTERFRLE